MKIAEARMRPGRFSQVGFLGPGESLRDVLEKDALTLKQIGVTFSELSGTIGSLLASAIECAPTVTTAGPYTVRLQRHKGRQACPFALDPHENNCSSRNDPRFATIDWRISNPRNGVHLAGPGLIVHLIGEHGFFEGLGSPYRVSPTRLVELLEVGSANLRQTKVFVPLRNSLLS